MMRSVLIKKMQHAITVLNIESKFSQLLYGCAERKK